MINKTIRLTTILFFFISLFSCLKEKVERKGVCESYWGISSPDYYCALTGEENCFVGVHAYHAEKSCESLGYTEPYGGSGGPDGVKFVSPEGIKTPGVNGIFGNPNAYSGSGGSSGASCGLEDYDGPEFNIQVDSQCKTAFVYDCSGNTVGRDAACQTYYDYGNSVWTGSGPLPTCPYCN